MGELTVKQMHGSDLPEWCHALPLRLESNGEPVCFLVGTGIPNNVLRWEDFKKYEKLFQPMGKKVEIHYHDHINAVCDVYNGRFYLVGDCGTTEEIDVTFATCEDAHRNVLGVDFLTKFSAFGMGGNGFTFKF